MIQPQLLLVDDDALIAESLSFYLAKDFEVLACDSRENAVRLMRQFDDPPQLALVDLGLPPYPHRPDEGFKLIAALLAHAPGMKIVVLSGQTTDGGSQDEYGRRARALGAVEFIAKPADPARIRQALLQVQQAHTAEQVEFTMTMARPAPTADDFLADMIGSSAPMEDLKRTTKLYANSPFPVLIEGDSGSGKELVASCLHFASGRVRQPFLALNCAAVAPTLVEPTLFGYTKGAFTGATQNKSGYFEDAGEGTLFLDEVGELPLELQAKLLRVLENGEFQRVGETQTRTSKARIVAATNRDLRDEVKHTRFRGDLYHRLSVFSLRVPPLRERGPDKMVLLEHFRRLYSSAGNATPFMLSDSALTAWLEYDFPGNVRELRNVVIRLVTKYPGKLIERDALRAEFDVSGEKAPGQALDLVTASVETLEPLARKQLLTQSGFKLDEQLAMWEDAYMEAALKIASGNMSQVAKLLGINRTTLYSRMAVRDQRKAQE
jgi:DNA-binding NtrC family response regulator